MFGSQFFSFDRCNFREVVAHGGAGLIATERVFDGRGGTACDFVDLTIIPPSSEIGVHTHGIHDEGITSSSVAPERCTSMSERSPSDRETFSGIVRAVRTACATPEGRRFG